MSVSTNRVRVKVRKNPKVDTSAGNAQHEQPEFANSTSMRSEQYHQTQRFPAFQPPRESLASDGVTESDALSAYARTTAAKAYAQIGVGQPKIKINEDPEQLLEAQEIEERETVTPRWKKELAALEEEQERKRRGKRVCNSGNSLFWILVVFFGIILVGGIVGGVLASGANNDNDAAANNDDQNVETAAPTLADGFEQDFLDLCSRNAANDDFRDVFVCLDEDTMIVCDRGDINRVDCSGDADDKCFCEPLKIFQDTKDCFDDDEVSARCNAPRVDVSFT